jgi:RNA polymerase sigma-70 factor (ECF subfamily)
MSESVSQSQSEKLLIDRVRQGDADAWTALIARYEGRLLAFVRNRVADTATAEDIVQETFIGFVTSLPNFDERRSLESYLFSITAHKLTDHLRREGRRPTIPFVSSSTRTSSWEPPGRGRAASSIMRSSERKHYEESSLGRAIEEQIAKWRKRGDWIKIKCVELLFVRGRANKEVAETLGLTEQAVANHKFDFLTRLRGAVTKQKLPKDVFPELYEE